jgi:hypothetical protein
MIYPMIRTQSRYGFRPGEWGRIVDVVVYPQVETTTHSDHEKKYLSHRICFRVEFIDGYQDYWPVEDTDGQYEFKPSIKDEMKVNI